MTQSIILWDDVWMYQPIHDVRDYVESVFSDGQYVLDGRTCRPDGRSGFRLRTPKRAVASTLSTWRHLMAMRENQRTSLARKEKLILSRIVRLRSERVPEERIDLEYEQLEKLSKQRSAMEEMMKAGGNRLLRGRRRDRV